MKADSTLSPTMLLLKQLKEFNEALILALAIFLLLQFSVQNFKVEGSSMSTTIEPGQYVAVNKLHKFKVDMARLSALIPFWDASHMGEVYPFQRRGPQRGDIIVFNYPLDPERTFIKRVIGLPGEQVSIIRGYTYINGERLNEPYLTSGIQRENIEFDPLGPNDYFVMGDNRPHSNDSRHWENHFGVHRDHIIGTELVSYNLPIDLGFANPAD